MSTNNITAAQKIAEKWQQLRMSGFDLGQSTTTLKNGGHGGYYQIFVRGRIYHHPAIGTFEVHGNVLRAYLARNAMDRNPELGRREFGFPVADEDRTEDGLYARSKFEWGEIINVKGAGGAVGISGEIYKKWRKDRWLDRVGYPINGNVLGAYGELVYFERGIGYYSRHTTPTPRILELWLPLMGNPAILRPQDTEIPICLLIDQKDYEAIGRYSIFDQFIANRFYLREVGTSRKIPMEARGVKRSSSKGTTSPGQPIPVSKQFTLIFSLGKGECLLDRVLYDIVFKSDSGHDYSLSPHSIYVKESWENFGLIHATDIHVSRRIDTFKKKLYQAMIDDKDERLQLGVDALHNWNNNFRDLIKYANYLHAKGQLDGVIATGDLVDYLFEDGENREGGGNFELFKDIICGKSNYEDQDKTCEALRVPIFTTLGNHDYRINAYHLHQKLDIQWPFSNRSLPQYKPFNLEKFEAEAIDGYHFISTDEGRRQLKIAKSNYYFRYINHQSSYAVKLGQHHLLMIDSGSDTEIPDTGDAILDFLGFGTEDDGTFLKGTPNSVGYSHLDIALLKSVIKNTGDQGLIIIGTHAPPINTAQTEYPHYFRETEHPTADKYEIANYLRRVGKLDGGASYPGQHKKEVLRLAQNAYKDWSFTGTSFFKTGSHEDHFLDWGVSRGDAKELLELCAGKDMKRPIDLILFGHVHTRTELRIRWNEASKQLEYFHDYYTQNPDYYYYSKKYKGDFREIEKVKLEIRKDARPNGTPRTDEVKNRVLFVPPYTKPLEQASSAKKWWEEHRPLLIQGAPLGPVDNSERYLYAEPNFQGCKYITISNNKISKIQQVPRHQIRIIVPEPDKYYYIQPKVSHLNLEVTGNKTDDNIQIIQGKRHGQANQIWLLKKVEGISEYMYILSARSGKALTVQEDTNLIVQHSIVQDDDGLHRRQQWRLITTGDGYYYLYNRAKYMMLDVRGGSKLSNREIWVYPGNQTPAQKWRFLEINKSSYTYLPPEEGRDYFIRPKVSNEMYLDVKSGSLSDNAQVIQWSLHAGDNQVWRIRSVTETKEYFYIISKKSGKCLTVEGGIARQGTFIVQYPIQSDNSNLHLAQQWRMEPAKERHHYHLVNRHSGWVMDVRGGSKNKGADIWLYALNRTEAQQWQFVIDERSQKIPVQPTRTIKQVFTTVFSRDFPDAWKDFQDPELADFSERYYPVRFVIDPKQFSARFQSLKIEGIAIQFITKDGKLPPMAIGLHTGTEYKTNHMTYDGKANSWSGDRRERWDTVLGQSPIGTWNLAVPNNDTVWGWFQDGIIQDIQLTITYEARIGN